MHKFNGSSKNEVGFPGWIKKKSCGFSLGLGFLALKLERGVAQFCRISRGEALFSQEFRSLKRQT